MVELYHPLMGEFEMSLTGSTGPYGLLYDIRYYDCRVVVDVKD